MSKRALSPKTIDAYEKTLARALPDGVLDTRVVSTWGNSALNQLRCAIRWKTSAPLSEQLETALASKYVVTKQPYTPSEFEVSQLEEAANKLLPVNRSAVLLMLYLGLRVEEFYALTRRQVEKGVASNLLTFTRKGGAEASLDVEKVVGLFDDLLLAPARGPKNGFLAKRTHKWERVGEIYSAATPTAQYQVIRRIVMRCFRDAGLPVQSPHKLRHAFATRMNRDGASPFIIQAALNHKSIQTTQRYVHAGSADVAKFMRGPEKKK